MDLQSFLESSEEVWAGEVTRVTHENSGAKKKLGSFLDTIRELGHSTANLMSGKSDDEEEDPDYLKVVYRQGSAT